MTLTKSDRTKLIQEMEEKFVTKEEFAQALEQNNNYLVSTLTTKAELSKLVTKTEVAGLATREDLIEFKSELLGAINKLQEDDDAHKQLHHELGEDVPRLKHQVKKLFQELNIPQPAY